MPCYSVGYCPASANEYKKHCKYILYRNNIFIVMFVNYYCIHECSIFLSIYELSLYISVLDRN